ncbi:hypothetical protein J40TS1_29990 [Paenibacillus montaniterrae]|uniref:Uncharacterized protein n=1 Tax=Paenibacillus montaniterrae TaxID=429341 RepID=A0A919YMT4_9BACL|nr:hypothetical protein J40TS1_29990 [Paenibacillus montaniterrae]
MKCTMPGRANGRRLFYNRLRLFRRDKTENKGVGELSSLSRQFFNFEHGEKAYENPEYSMEFDTF